MNNREICSINAMTVYVVHNQNVPEESVRAIVEAHFFVNDIAEIDRTEYDRVIAFLVDMQYDLMVIN